jgi:glycosyltransferase involved in cell wall biosynthesis
VVVDDGSGPQFGAIFDELRRCPRVTVLCHARNRGKGAALKTGISYIAGQFPDAAGIVTADADGQHHPEDILAVAARMAETPGALILGSRGFDGDVPLRSRFGNQLTRHVMKIVLGRDLSDTQTGLRAVPRALMDRLLEVPAAGYEFELEMLVAAKHLGVEVYEQPIRTIYEPNNPSSHFHPLRDSMRIYFVLLRFSLVSLASAALDNLLFYLAIQAGANLAAAQLGARLISVAFNYAGVRRAAFHSREAHSVVLPRYLALVCVNVILSYLAIRGLTAALALNLFAGKLLAETLLFFANFAIQRDCIFTRKAPAPAPALRFKETAG